MMNEALNDMSWTLHYQPANASLWSGRKDGERPLRYHEIVQPIHLNAAAPSFAIEKLKTPLCMLGFKCDAGVARNLGRQGAAEGPDALRTALAKLPLPPPCDNLSFIDFGSICCDDGNLESAQLALANCIAFIKSRCNLDPVVIGGGHETAYGHFLGLRKIYPAAEIAIVNIDAHFDLRPLHNGQGSSGTPFLQIQQLQSEQKHPFKYVCMGIQPSSNTAALFDKANDLNVNFYLADAMHQNKLSDCLNFLDHALAGYQNIFLSLDMDVFASSCAPGVSAPQPLGLFPWHVIPIIRHLKKNYHLMAANIVELAPPYDRDHQTVQLAACLASELL